MKYMIILLLVLTCGCVEPTEIPIETPAITPIETSIIEGPVMYIYLMDNERLVSSHIVEGDVYSLNEDLEVMGKVNYGLNNSWGGWAGRIRFNTSEKEISWGGRYIVSDYPLVGDEWSWN